MIRKSRLVAVAVVVAIALAELAFAEIQASEIL
jgi:hypothetical protein